MCNNKQFPSFEELKDYIKLHSKSTICQIRDAFDMRGDSVISNLRNRKKMILAYDINDEFFRHLQQFIKQDYVICETDMMACLVSDNTRYVGKGKFLPIVLSIQS